MRKWIALILLLALAGCGGGAGSPRVVPTGPSSPDANAAQQQALAGKLGLSLSAIAEGGDYRLLLNAPGAVDLYQIAGTLKYDPARYTVISTEAGGGLGGPEACLFLCGEPAPGQLAFAYTKRYYGPGASGSLNLLSVKVSPKSGFKLDDFELDPAPGKLRARDSQKQAFAATVEVAR